MYKYLRQYTSRILKRLAFIFPDRFYLRMLYYLVMGKKLNLNHPKLFSEKIQWLKLHQKNQIFTQLVDKITVKEYVSNLIGQDIICPILKIWEDVEKINFDELPNEFVLKTTHDGGNCGVIVCNNKKQLNIPAAKEKLKQSMRHNVYIRYREWPYKNIKHRIFAEQYLGNNIMDYKFYCCNGEVVCILLCTERQNNNVKYFFLDKQWNLCPYNNDSIYLKNAFSYPPPSNLDEMLVISSKLSVGFPFVRIDLYDINGHIYFGEFTFYPASGLDSKKTAEFEEILGKKIHLPTDNS